MYVGPWKVSRVSGTTLEVYQRSSNVLEWIFKLLKKLGATFDSSSRTEGKYLFQILTVNFEGYREWIEDVECFRMFSNVVESCLKVVRNGSEVILEWHLQSSLSISFDDLQNTFDHLQSPSKNLRSPSIKKSIEGRLRHRMLSKVVESFMHSFFMTKVPKIENEIS